MTSIIEHCGGDRETIITLSGEFVLSENAVEMEDTAYPDHYHFLVGIFNSEYEGDRSFAPMYGYTEILPGRITTDEIVCADGKSYLNLADNKLRVIFRRLICSVSSVFTPNKVQLLNKN